MYFPEDIVEPLLPFVVGEDLQLDLFMFLEVYFLKRLDTINVGVVD